jgi:hypothetical protein
MDLYTKTTQGKRTRYIPYVPPEPQPIKTDPLTDEGIITLGTSVGTIVLMQLEALIPAHKRNHRKVKAVTDALLDLARGNGAPIDRELLEHWTECWNQTMVLFQSGLEEK